jgi:hypothetical protein
VIQQKLFISLKRSVLVGLALFGGIPLTLGVVGRGQHGGGGAQQPVIAARAESGS